MYTMLPLIYLNLPPIYSYLAANSPPPKPWEQAGSSSGPTPFKPPSPGSTSDVVEASGTAKPGEIVSTTDRNTPANRNALGRPVPARPWEQQTYGSTYGGNSFLIIWCYLSCLVGLSVLFEIYHIGSRSPDDGMYVARCLICAY